MEQARSLCKPKKPGAYMTGFFYWAKRVSLEGSGDIAGALEAGSMEGTLTRAETFACAASPTYPQRCAGHREPRALAYTQVNSAPSKKICAE